MHVSNSTDSSGVAPDRYLTTDAVAERLGVSARTIHRLIDAGELAAFRVGRQRRVAESDLGAFVEEYRERPDRARRAAAAGQARRLPTERR